ncbi:MAG: imidazole glycerol phosphate synthase subunit HisH [bacterium]
MTSRLAILDCGIGNLRSVAKAFERSGAEVVVTSEVAAAEAADGLVLPGVGAFPAAMKRVRAQGVADLIGRSIADGKPLLGICLGMQLLFERSSEGEGAEGLGLLEGSVEPISAPGLKIPHIGWERVTWEKSDPLVGDGETADDFYFVHGYAARPRNQEDTLGTSVYGESFCAAVSSGNIWGVQFHPEKSSATGLGLLRRFVEVCER